MIGLFHKLCIFSAALPLAACASFDGMPKPIMDIKSAATIPLNLQREQVSAEMREPTRTADGKKELRNDVIGAYLGAMDARYAEFRRALAKEVRGGNFGLEIATLGIGGIGTVWSKAAEEINAATTFLTGSKAALNKEVYFQQTLPALVAMMDANRFKARGAILSHLRDSIADYPLQLAYADLASYELAGSIDGAVQQLAAEANKKVQAEEAHYRAVTTCDVKDEATSALWNQISRSAYRLAGWSDPENAPTQFPGTAKTKDLKAAAEAFTGDTFNEATNQEEANRQVEAITTALGSVCKIDQLNSLVQAANLKLGD